MVGHEGLLEIVVFEVMQEAIKGGLIALWVDPGGEVTNVARAS